MANPLDSIAGVEVTPVPDLAELFPPALQPMQVPQASVRNNAAMQAMLSGGAEGVASKYKQLMSEATVDGQGTFSKVHRENIDAGVKKMDHATVVGILSNASSTMEQKQRAVEAATRSDFLREPAVNVMSQGLSAPSKGEDVRAEGARSSLAETLRPMFEAQAEMQGLVNTHGASIREGDIITVAEAADFLVNIGANNASLAQFRSALDKETGKKRGVFKQIKDFLVAGSSMEEVRKSLSELPPAKQVEMTKTMLKLLQSDHSTMFFKENQFAQMMRAQQIFDEGGYSSTDKFLDNFSPLLDVFGLRSAKGGKLAVKGQALGTPPGVSTAAKDAERIDPTFDSSVNNKFPTEDAGFSETWRETLKKKKEDAVKAKQSLEDLKQNSQVKLQNPTIRLENGQRRIERTVEQDMSRIETNTVISPFNPASPSSLLQSTNPEKAIAALKSVVEDSTGEVSQALYGVSKEEAIASDMLPKVGEVGGRVFTKPVNMESAFKLSGDQFTAEELLSAEKSFTHDFNNATQVQVVPGMTTTITRDGGGITVAGVYSSPSGAWNSAAEAIRQTEFAFRNHGINVSDITLLKKEGLDHVPVDIIEALDKPGNYLVQVNSTHEITYKDVGVMSKGSDVRLNLLDRVPGLMWDHKGSASRWLFDSSSMLDPIYTKAGITANDTAAELEHQLLKVATEFSDKFMKLGVGDRKVVDDYFREANLNRIPYSSTDLANRGFTPEMRETVSKWRAYWDKVYEHENLDSVRTLVKEGYQLFTHANARLFVKPIQKNSSIIKVYDPASDQVVSLTKVEQDALYDAGGNLAVLRRPESFSGVDTGHMILRNTTNEHSRTLRHSDRILNYLDGYYAVRYKAPRWVDEVEYGTAGEIISRRAIAVAGDTKTAEMFATGQASSTGKKYLVRADDRSAAANSNDWWDVNSAQGRIAQRHRGEPLVTAKGVNAIGEGSFLVDPVSTAAHAARSLSDRTMMRPMLEAAKERFINQYKGVLTAVEGQYRFPSQLSEIGTKGGATSREVAQARSVYEHIAYLEHGYINSMDDGIKQMFHSLADIDIIKRVPIVERALLALGEGSLTSTVKGGVFAATIVANPLRQLFIQSHQMIRTMAYNPSGWSSGRVPKLMTDFFTPDGLTFGVTKDVKFLEFLDKSGLVSAISRNSLVSGTLLDAANLGHGIGGKIMNMLRKYGFDKGELANTVAHAAAVYDRYKSTGRAVHTEDVRKEMHSEVRALSWDMNHAGDMPYNQTSPAMALQFLQVPHKALLQLFNRRLLLEDRAKLFLTDSIIWGVPSALAVESFLYGKQMIEDPEIREFMKDGLESLLLNAFLREGLDDPTVGVDFSSLRPDDMGGWKKAIETMFSTKGGPAAILANSPAGTLLKEGGRVRKALSSASRFFGMQEDIDPEKPEEFLEMLHMFARISSGWSAGTKAWAGMEAQKSFDKKGRVTDEDLRPVEVFLGMLGFPGKKAGEIAALSDKVNTESKEFKDEVKQDIKTVIEYYAAHLNVANNDPEFLRKVTNPMNFALRRYTDNATAMKIINSEINIALKSRDSALMETILKSSDIPGVQKLEAKIRDTQFPEMEKQRLLEMITHFRNISDQKRESK